MSQNQNSIYDCWNRIGVWGRNVERCPELGRVIHCRNCTVYSAAGRQLLNRSLSSDYQNEWTGRLAEEQEKKHSDIKSAFVFRAGAQWFALPCTAVREIADIGPIHSIPHRSNNILRGVVNIKGKLEICVSVGAVLGIERCEIAEQTNQYVAPTRLIVVVNNNQVLAFPVTEIMGIIRYRPEAVRDLPVAAPGTHAVYASGILHHDNKEITFLKFKQLFRSLTRYLA
jgi:chemotaxis-related protein WspD